MTGFEKEQFLLLLNFLNPGDNNENMKFYDSKKLDTSVDEGSDVIASSSKRGPKPKMAPIEQLFMLVTWLRNGFTLHLTSWLFDIPKSTASRYIITWINFIYFSLGSIQIWPSRERCILRSFCPHNCNDFIQARRQVI